MGDGLQRNQAYNSKAPAYGLNVNVSPDGSYASMSSIKAEKRGSHSPASESEMRRVWNLSFESSDVAERGGLGTAVAILSKALAKTLDVSVFMPSHGRHFDVRFREKLGLHDVHGFTSEGARRGVDGNLYPYLIGMEEGYFQGVRYFLAKGLDQNTSRWLDDWQIYDGELVYQKMSLLARAMRGYVDFLLKEHPERRPDVIHAHDWHAIPAAVSVKQVFLEKRMSVPLVFTIHLLNDKGLPWHYLSENWCGIKDEPHYVSINGEKRLVTYSEAWSELSGGKFERYGAVEADFLTSVSRSYLHSDVLPFLGLNFSKKAGYIYNGCDWDEGKIREGVLREHAQRMGRLANMKPDRFDLRRYLLIKALGETSTRAISESELSSVVGGLSGLAGIRKSGGLEPFSDDGMLVLMTGRLDRQKGVDVLLRAVPEVLDVLPGTKFLFLLIPLQGELIVATIREAAKYDKNIRVLLGRVPEIYGLAHISADVYAMPSRWEPFGIAALEAMATGNPVVGTSVGGITETVLDILDNEEKGTGHLFMVDDHRELARGLICFLAMMKIDEDARRGLSQNLRHSLDIIPYDSIRELVAQDPATGSLVRKNCRTRVERHFSPRNAAQMAVKAYEQASIASSHRNAQT